MMHTLVKKHIAFLVVALSIFVFGVVGMWGFSTLMFSKKEKVITVRQALVSYEENKKIFSEESVALAKIKERVTTLEQFRVTVDTTPQLLSALEDLAKRNDIAFAITSVQTLGTVGAEKLTISFSATGEAPLIDVFIKELSHQTYQVKITKLSLFMDGQSASVVPTTGINGSVSTMAPAAVENPKTAVWNMLATIEIVSF